MPRAGGLVSFGGNFLQLNERLFHFDLVERALWAGRASAMNFFPSGGVKWAITASDTPAPRTIRSAATTTREYRFELEDV